MLSLAWQREGLPLEFNALQDRLTVRSFSFRWRVYVLHRFSLGTRAVPRQRNRRVGSGVPIAGGQKPTLSRCRIGLPQRNIYSEAETLKSFAGDVAIERNTHGNKF
jgi:hypothetical protein